MSKLKLKTGSLIEQRFIEEDAYHNDLLDGAGKKYLSSTSLKDIANLSVKRVSTQSTGFGKKYHLMIERILKGLKVEIIDKMAAKKLGPEIPEHYLVCTAGEACLLYTSPSPRDS